MEAWEGTSLYVHVPFCARACPYCDFDFVVGRRPDFAGLLGGLKAQAHGLLGDERPEVRTVYIGGGTPSLLGPAALTDLAAWIMTRFRCDDAEEFTVELNPEHVDDALLEALRRSGVDRVSIGAQSASAAGLATLGRRHAPAEGFASARRAQAAGLRASVDVIVGWPGQSDAALREDLAAADASGAGHVSIYALTVEPGTPWEALERRGTRTRPDPDRQADLLSRIDEDLTRRGFEHYETASYARPGQIGRHNWGYWSWRDVIGLGPSASSVAHGGEGVVRRTARRGFATWRQDPTGADLDELEPRVAAAEGLWLGLRRAAGVDVAQFIRRFPAVDEAWVRGRVERQVRRGNLRWRGQVVSLAPGRWLWHDEVGIDVLAPEGARTPEGG
jgi:oxygen-independent coproporphyrinogen-3 oxidase